MPKLVQRLLIFFVGIPAVICFIVPKVLNHLPFNFLIVFFSVLASIEMSTMLSAKGKTISKFILVPASAVLPLTAYLCGLFGWDFIFVDIVLAVVCMIIFAVEIFTEKTFEESNHAITSGIFTVVYSGFLMTFLSRLCTFEHSVEVICLFVMLVFISDSAAWLFGMTLGKNNRGIIAASPNKSIAGFVGAYLGTIFTAILVKYFIWPQVFAQLSLIKLLILAVCVTTAAIIGDLAESVVKRSSGCKDSGQIILGRGGALDSIDSLLAAAPFYFILLKYFI
ncbi:phosphatidate cytidylyltransferase [Treponema sp.]|uniref:phosphatidate cytidylyltransferase n=1 Tax=Treponema sp. TaxID=166 RepID=UPI00298DF652|nr:phosphatidate cytidylyltransferase [Treponema sp.]MCR5613207.1 phosphatidate cytidylyltransferase [Treponema sp.]